MVEYHKYPGCPWCGKHHTPKKGRIKNPKTGKSYCKCKEPLKCVCDNEDYGTENCYCPKCGSGYGSPEW